MLRSLFLFLLTFFVPFSFAQNHAYETAINSFKEAYNEGDYEKVFHQFSEPMQQVLSLDKTKEFLDHLQQQHGKIQTTKFTSFQEGSYASYETTFDNGVLALNVSLDDAKKMNGLYIQPFVQAINKTINALTQLPDHQAEIIFNSVRAFPNNTQLSIAIIENSKISYYGVLKMNDSVKTLSNNRNHFEIGSITKVFTATVLAELVAKKKLALSDPINPYFNEPFKSGPNVTFQALANHTSGFPRLPPNVDMATIDQTNPYKDYLERDLIEGVDHLKGFSELKNKYDYSNFGAAVLGYTMGKSQHSTYLNLLQKTVFNRYGLKNTFTSSKGIDSLVKGLDAEGKETSNWDFDVLFPGGGLVSTVEDLSTFALAQFKPKNKALALTRIPTHTISKSLFIGLGWHISVEESGNTYVWHNGGTGGYTSLMALDINNQNGVIILSNVSGYSPNMGNIDQMGFALMEELKKK